MEFRKTRKTRKSQSTFDDFVLNQSGVLNYTDLKVLDIGCSNGFKTEMEELLDKMSKKFEDNNFYYAMTVLYYIAKREN